MYAIFGSMRQITVGPTAVMAIMAREYVDKGGIQYAIMLSFLAGCVELTAGLLNLGIKSHSIPAFRLFNYLTLMTLIISLRFLDGIYIGTSYLRILFSCGCHCHSCSIKNTTRPEISRLFLYQSVPGCLFKLA